MHPHGSFDEPYNRAEPRDPIPAGSFFLERLAAAVSRASAGGPLHYLTTLHPCFIDGVRTLVHRRGLERETPSVFQRLRAYALRHGFALIEERRKRELACRDERRRLVPVLMFAAGLAGSAVMADDGMLREAGVAVIPTIEIIDERQAGARAYLVEAGARFVAKPHGTLELIVGVAGEVRARGVHTRVRSRALQVSAAHADTFVERYDYRMPADCGGKPFSYYEGDGFAALGYHAVRGVMVLDVLAGGGPFAAPRPWDTYDQVLNSNTRMDLLLGDGAADGIGLLKASYRITLTPAARTGAKNYYGELYSRALAAAAACVAPAVRQARATAMDADAAG